MKKILALTLVSVFAIACTGKSSREEDQSNPPALELSDSTQPAGEAVVNDDIVVNDQNETTLSDLNAQPVEGADSVIGSGPVINDKTDMPSGAIVKKTYKVHKSETLMLIAFKLYGDYSKWKELRDLNKGKLKRGMLLKAGDEIDYMTDGTEFVWSPNGNPHLIKHGESLSLISKEHYGTLKRWKEIFDNNRPMIKEPNKIFAGFTLYYVPDSKSVALQ